MEYLGNPIYTIGFLCRVLRVTPARFFEIYRTREKFYSHRWLKKSDGGDRKLIRFHGGLSQLHEKIKSEILDAVCFPAHVYGIAGRDHLDNAKRHLGARYLLSMDIKQFFDSVDKSRVRLVFEKRLNFSRRVSDVLADIICVEGVLPQGSPVSTHIANLVLFGEGTLVREFRSEGLIYTRYVDDISVSCHGKKLSREEKTRIISRMNRFIRGNGFRVKHKKTKVAGGNRQKVVTGCVIGSDGQIRVPKSYVEDLFMRIVGGESGPTIDGQLAYVRRVNPRQLGTLRKRLRRQGIDR